MTPDLSRRIAAAFGAGAATHAERDLLRTAALPAAVRDAGDLSEDARTLLRDLETRGRPDRPPERATARDVEAFDRLHATNRMTMDYPVDVQNPTV